MTVEMVQEVAKQDSIYQKLKAAVLRGQKPTDRELVPYMSVWPELAVMEELAAWPARHPWRRTPGTR